MKPMTTAPGDGQRLYRQQHVGGGQHCLSAVGPFDLLEAAVGEMGAGAGAMLEQHAHARGRQFIGNFRNQADARFPRRTLTKRADCDRHIVLLDYEPAGAAPQHPGGAHPIGAL
jgi:hypothetical protein